MKVYLDSAATTAMDKEVIEVMAAGMGEVFGNPSSTHQFGRTAKAALEKARKQIAQTLNALPGEIFFTSGGTEADNIAIRGLVKAYGIEHIVSTTIEHHAVEHTVEAMREERGVKITYLSVNEFGDIDYDELEDLLSKESNVLVTLMHANNEIGNLLDLERVGNMCEKYNAVLHSDTVQTVGHFPIDTQKLKVNTLAGAAHKFHGPKGVGFLYLRKGSKMQPLMTGGGQERELRSGTENLWGIVGMAKALEVETRDMEENIAYIKGLKQYMIDLLKEKVEGVSFNGRSAELDNSLYTVLNVSIPPVDHKDMLLFMLDMKGVAVSGGSACSSGANVGSHVIAGLGKNIDNMNLRFSFSKYNTKEELDYAVEQLVSILNQ